MTNAVVIRYETRADAAAENARLIEQVFAQLHRERPDGLTYTVLRLANGTGFVHIVAYDDESASLTGLSAFQEFQRDSAQRFAVPPERSDATVIGSYQALAPVTGAS